MTTLSLDRPRSFFDALHRTEAAFLALILCILAVNLTLAAQPDRAIDWGSFAKGGLSCIGLFLIGLYVRVRKDTERLGKIVTMIGLNSLFGLSMAILFHLLMPRPTPVLTEFLLWSDALFNYHWPDAVAWVAQVPYAGLITSLIYKSSFFQIVAVMITLGALHRFRQLDRMVFANAIALIIVLMVWQAFPNLSQSTYFVIPPETERAAHLVTTTAYGAALLEMARNGLPVVAMDRILGAVAFPSYHMVMCVLVVWFARATPLFWPLLLINLIMVPAILVHGAHHVVDVIGGALVFAVALVPSYALVKRLNPAR